MSQFKSDQTDEKNFIILKFTRRNLSYNNQYPKKALNPKIQIDTTSRKDLNFEICHEIYFWALFQAIYQILT